MKTNEILRLMNKELGSVKFQNNYYVSLVFNNIEGSDVNMYIKVVLDGELNVNTIEADTFKFMKDVYRTLRSAVAITDCVIAIDGEYYEDNGDLVYRIYFKLINGEWREKLLKAHEQEQDVLKLKEKKEAEKEFEREWKLYERLKKKFEND